MLETLPRSSIVICRGTVRIPSVSDTVQTASGKVSVSESGKPLSPRGVRAGGAAAGMGREPAASEPAGNRVRREGTCV